MSYHFPKLSGKGARLLNEISELYNNLRHPPVNDPNYINHKILVEERARTRREIRPEPEWEQRLFGYDLIPEDYMPIENKVRRRHLRQKSQLRESAMLRKWTTRQMSKQRNEYEFEKWRYKGLRVAEDIHKLLIWFNKLIKGVAIAVPVVVASYWALKSYLARNRKKEELSDREFDVIYGAYEREKNHFISKKIYRSMYYPNVEETDLGPYDYNEVNYEPQDQSQQEVMRNIYDSRRNTYLDQLKKARNDDELERKSTSILLNEGAIPDPEVQHTIEHLISPMGEWNTTNVVRNKLPNEHDLYAWKGYHDRNPDVSMEPFFRQTKLIGNKGVVGRLLDEEGPRFDLSFVPKVVHIPCKSFFIFFFF